MLSLSTFINLAKSLILLGFNKMQDTKCSVFTELFKNTDYIHKSFLVAQQLSGQRVGEEFESLLITIISMPLEQATGKHASYHASWHVVEEAGGRE